MANGIGVKSKGAKYIGLLGSLLLLLTLAYPFAAYFAFVPSSHAGTGAASVAVQTPIAATATSKATNPSLPEKDSKKKEPEVELVIELQKASAELSKYAALTEYLKIFLPVFSAMFLVVLGTLGYYFVQLQVQTAVTSSIDDLTQKANAAESAMSTAQNSLSQAIARIAQLEKEMEALIDIRLGTASVSIDHAISVTSSRTPGGYSDAIIYGTRNFERIETLLPQLEKSIDLAKAANKPERALALQERFEELKDFGIAVKADLAYYFAQRFEDTRNRGDRNDSLKFARAAVTEIPKVADFFERLNLIDNYLFAISRDISDLTVTDKEKFVDLFEEYRDPLRNLLSEDSDKPLWDSYQKAFTEFKSWIANNSITRAVA